MSEAEPSAAEMIAIVMMRDDGSSCTRGSTASSTMRMARVPELDQQLRSGFGDDPPLAEEGALWASSGNVIVGVAFGVHQTIARRHHERADIL